MSNDVDPDGDLIQAALVETTAYGELVFNEDGSFSYTPNRDYFGPDSFTYTVSDGISISPVEVVILNVSNVPDSPVAIEDIYATDPGGSIIVEEQDGVLANDYDPDQSALEAVLVNGVTSGELVLNPNGAFFYRPADQNPGVVSFAYRASDGALSSSVTTVRIYLDQDQYLF